MAAEFCLIAQQSHAVSLDQSNNLNRKRRVTQRLDHMLQLCSNALRNNQIFGFCGAVMHALTLKLGKTDEFIFR